MLAGAAGGLPVVRFLEAVRTREFGALFWGAEVGLTGCGRRGGMLRRRWRVGLSLFASAMLVLAGCGDSGAATTSGGVLVIDAIETDAEAVADSVCESLVPLAETTFRDLLLPELARDAVVSTTGRHGAFRAEVYRGTGNPQLSCSWGAQVRSVQTVAGLHAWGLVVTWSTFEGPDVSCPRAANIEPGGSCAVEQLSGGRDVSIGVTDTKYASATTTDPNGRTVRLQMTTTPSSGVVLTPAAEAMVDDVRPAVLAFIDAAATLRVEPASRDASGEEPEPSRATS